MRKIHAEEHDRKKREEKDIAMFSCFPNKRERVS
jgi:hypothetical protein